MLYTILTPVSAFDDTVTSLEIVQIEEERHDGGFLP
jgi:hypothetical protein